MTTTFALLAILCSLCSLALSFDARNVAKRTASQRQNPASSESRLRSIEQQLVEQADTMTTLANRVKMQRVRTAANHVSDPTSVEPRTVKDELRIRAGLRAGQPAPHK